MNPLSKRDVLYRLWRLRRLILVTVLLPLPGILLAGLFGFGLTLSGGGGAVLVLWTMATVALALWFPNGWTDNLTLALTLAGMTILSPIAPILGIDGVLGVIIGFLVLCAGWLALSMTLPEWLDGKSLGRIKQTFRRTVAADPEALRDALFLRPKARCGLYDCGPATKDGIFDVRLRGAGANAATGGQEITCRARVLKRDKTAQVTQFFSAEDPAISSTTQESIKAKDAGALYQKKDVHDHFSLFAALGFWLTDYEMDHFTATLDFVQGTPPRALMLQPDDGLLFFLGQRVTGISQDEPA